MGKEITLPWTCETSDIMKRCVKWTLLISMPLILIHLIIDPRHPIFGDGIFDFIFGLFGTIFCWLGAIINWESNDDLPSFHCKKQKVGSVE